MRRVLKWIVGGFAILLWLGTVAYATQPGYHRAITPGLFGMAHPAPNLYIDDPSQAEIVLAHIAAAEATTSDFFGALSANPTYVVCTTQVCKEDFGITPIGLSLGYQLILIAPGGVNELIFTHERVHAELHRSMGVRDIFDPRFPAWFDEGLASHLSGDPRLNRPADARAADWIRSARTFRDWNKLHPPHNWKDTYGAAARLVQEIEADVGRAGLRQLIAQVASGAPFARALEDLR